MEDVQPGIQGQEAVRQAIRLRMGQMRWSALDLAAEAKVSYNTINEFLTGRRDWPRPRTRDLLERALSWEPGTMDRVARSGDAGEATGDIGRSDGAAVVLSDELRPAVVDWPPDAFRGLTDAERAEVEAAALAAGLERLRQVRRARAHSEGADNGSSGGARDG